MTAPLDLHKTAATNPAVDARLVEEALACRRLLQKAGLLRKADYRLSPPLGGGMRNRKVAQIPAPGSPRPR